MEQTICLIKPNLMKKNFSEAIIEITSHGFRIVKQKTMQMTKEIAEEFYTEHKDRLFFNDLIKFMTSTEIIVLLLEKENAVASFRELVGHTNPLQAAENTLRRKYGDSIDENAFHGSDSIASAIRESKILFG